MQHDDTWPGVVVAVSVQPGSGFVKQHVPHMPSPAAPIGTTQSLEASSSGAFTTAARHNGPTTGSSFPTHAHHATFPESCSPQVDAAADVPASRRSGGGTCHATGSCRPSPSQYSACTAGHPSPVAGGAQTEAPSAQQQQHSPSGPSLHRTAYGLAPAGPAGAAGAALPDAATCEPGTWPAHSSSGGPPFTGPAYVSSWPDPAACMQPLPSGNLSSYSEATSSSATWRQQQLPQRHACRPQQHRSPHPQSSFSTSHSVPCAPASAVDGAGGGTGMRAACAGAGGPGVAAAQDGPARPGAPALRPPLTGHHLLSPNKVTKLHATAACSPRQSFGLSLSQQQQAAQAQQQQQGAQASAHSYGCRSVGSPGGGSAAAGATTPPWASMAACFQSAAPPAVASTDPCANSGTAAQQTPPGANNSCSSEPSLSEPCDALPATAFGAFAHGAGARCRASPSPLSGIGLAAATATTSAASPGSGSGAGQARGGRPTTSPPGGAIELLHAYSEPLPFSAPSPHSHPRLGAGACQQPQHSGGHSAARPARPSRGGGMECPAGGQPQAPAGVPCRGLGWADWPLQQHSPEQQQQLQQRSGVAGPSPLPLHAGPAAGPSGQPSPQASVGLLGSAPSCPADFLHLPPAAGRSSAGAVANAGGGSAGGATSGVGGAGSPPAGTSTVGVACGPPRRVSAPGAAPVNAAGAVQEIARSSTGGGATAALPDGSAAAALPASQLPAPEHVWAEAAAAVTNAMRRSAGSGAGAGFSFAAASPAAAAAAASPPSKVQPLPDPFAVSGGGGGAYTDPHSPEEAEHSLGHSYSPCLAPGGHGHRHHQGLTPYHSAPYPPYYAPHRYPHHPPTPPYYGAEYEYEYDYHPLGSGGTPPWVHAHVPVCSPRAPAGGPAAAAADRGMGYAYEQAEGAGRLLPQRAGHHLHPPSLGVRVPRHQVLRRFAGVPPGGAPAAAAAGGAAEPLPCAFGLQSAASAPLWPHSREEFEQANTAAHACYSSFSMDDAPVPVPGSVVAGIKAELREVSAGLQARRRQHQLRLLQQHAASAGAPLDAASPGAGQARPESAGAAGVREGAPSAGAAAWPSGAAGLTTTLSEPLHCETGMTHGSARMSWTAGAGAGNPANGRYPCLAAAASMEHSASSYSGMPPGSAAAAAAAAPRSSSNGSGGYMQGLWFKRPAAGDAPGVAAAATAGGGASLSTAGTPPATTTPASQAATAAGKHAAAATASLSPGAAALTTSPEQRQRQQQQHPGCSMGQGQGPTPSPMLPTSPLPFSCLSPAQSGGPAAASQGAPHTQPREGAACLPSLEGLSSPQRGSEAGTPSIRPTQSHCSQPGNPATAGAGGDATAAPAAGVAPPRVPRPLAPGAHRYPPAVPAATAVVASGGGASAGAGNSAGAVAAAPAPAAAVAAGGRAGMPYETSGDAEDDGEEVHGPPRRLPPSHSPYKHHPYYHPHHPPPPGYVFTGPPPPHHAHRAYPYPPPHHGHYSEAMMSPRTAPGGYYMYRSGVPPPSPHGYGPQDGLPYSPGHGMPPPHYGGHSPGVYASSRKAPMYRMPPGAPYGYGYGYEHPALPYAHDHDELPQQQQYQMHEESAAVAGAHGGDGPGAGTYPPCTGPGQAPSPGGANGALHGAQDGSPLLSWPGPDAGATGLHDGA